MNKIRNMLIVLILISSIGIVNAYTDIAQKNNICIFGYCLDFDTLSLVSDTLIFKVDGSTSGKTVVSGTEVKLEVSNVCPNWGTHFVSITDGYKEIVPMVVADSSGYASTKYIITKSIEIYAYSDCGGGNSNSIKIIIPYIPVFKVDGSTSGKTVVSGTEVKLEVSNLVPNWGMNFISITDGYVSVARVIVDSSGYASTKYIITKSIEIYAVSDSPDGSNSNSIKINVDSLPPVSDKPKPVIIPPALSRIWESLMSWLSSWFPLLSITGGSTVNVPINTPYSTSMSLAFGVPDTVYSDGSYTAKFGQWIVVDSNKNLKYESGWTNELIASPYTVTASYTPTSAGKYFLVGLINKQTYTWNGAQWVMTEVIETKEVQELVVGLPNVPVTKPIGVSVYLNDLFGWLKGLFSWLPW